MTWFKVDDSFHDHPKVVSMRGRPQYANAVALWTLAGCWCSRHLTDGFVPEVLPKELGFRSEASALLVECGLWEREKGGYRYHDWTAQQPTRAKVEKAREDSRSRVSAWREKRAAEAQKQSAVTPLHERTPDACNAPPDPTRPDPTNSEERERETARSGEPYARGTHAPALARAREGAEPWTAERQSRAFRGAWVKARKVEPSMFGRNVGDFHQRVLGTAEARGVEPEKLFREVLSRFVQGELNERERGSPYACFAQRWGELVDAAGGADLPDDLRAMQAQLDEDLRRMGGRGQHGGR